MRDHRSRDVIPIVGVAQTPARCGEREIDPPPVNEYMRLGPSPLFALPAPILVCALLLVPVAAPSGPPLPTAYPSVGAPGPPLRNLLEAPVVLGEPSQLGPYIRGPPVPASQDFTLAITLSGPTAGGGGPSHSPNSTGTALPSDRPLDLLRAYLRSAGLRVTAPEGSFMWLLEGSTSQVDRAFSTSLVAYSRPGSSTTWFAFAEPPSLPAGSPVSTLFPPTPSGTGPMHPASLQSGPRLSPGPSTSCGGGLSPAQVQGAYNVTPVLTAGNRGQGETIGIVDAYDPTEPPSVLRSDLAAFDQCFSLPPANLTVAYPVPGGNMNGTSNSTGWGLETALDVEWAHATAPDANLTLVLSPNSGYGLYYGVDWLVANNLADVISLSWGEPELGIYNGGPCNFQCNATTDGSFATLGPVLSAAATRGISVFAASGDCGANGGTSLFTPWYPASDVHAIGVGGTVLTVGPGNTYGSEHGWSGTQTMCQNQGGSGGGFSVVARPPWQTGPGFASFSNTTRGVPDVALTAGTPLEMVYHGNGVSVEGTSDAAPQWAGLGALVGTARGGGPPGFLSPILYDILNSSQYATDFHPITQGNNGFPARYGWNPVTGIGTPDFTHLLSTVVGMPEGMSPAPTPLTLSVTPLAGQVPLPVQFETSVPKGDPPPSFVSYDFGDVGPPYGEANASSGPSLTVNHTYVAAGAYTVWSTAYWTDGAAGASPPSVLNLENAGPLHVTLSASATSVSAGTPVTFTANTSGGTGPYHDVFYFGDGTVAGGLLADPGSVETHAFPRNGTYVVTVVSNDSSHPVRAGEASLCLRVGSTTSPCPSTAPPLVVALDSSAGSVNSLGTLAIRVNVTSDGIGMSGATVKFSTSAGSVSPATNLTNSSGVVLATYHAPSVNSSHEVEIWANVSAPNGQTGGGLRALWVNPITGPTLIPWIRPAQSQVVAGSTDALVIGATVLGTGGTVPGARFVIQSSSGNLTPASGTLGWAGDGVSILRAPTGAGLGSISLTLTASAPGYTTGSTRGMVGTSPLPSGGNATRVSVAIPANTVVSREGIPVWINLTAPGGIPLPAPASSLNVTDLAGGSFGPVVATGPGSYRVPYAAPASLASTTDILLVNVSGNLSRAAASGGIAVSVLAFSATLRVDVSPFPLTAHGPGSVPLTFHATLVSPPSGIAYPVPLVGIWVNVTASPGMLSRGLGPTNFTGDFATILNTSLDAGNITLTLSASGPPYLGFREMLVLRITPYPNPGGPAIPGFLGPDATVLWTATATGVAVFLVVAFQRRRRAPPEPWREDSPPVPDAEPWNEQGGTDPIPLGGDGPPPGMG